MTIDIVRYEVQVGPQDIDVLNHVNNRVYLRWVEEAATTASAQNGWSTQDYLKLGAAWMAREHWIEYLRPCVLNDTIEIYTWIAMKNHGKLCCVAATEWVFVDLTVRRAIECPENVASCFVTVPSDDARLKELGIARCVRFAPVGLA